MKTEQEKRLDRIKELDREIAALESERDRLVMEADRAARHALFGAPDN